MNSIGHPEAAARLRLIAGPQSSGQMEVNTKHPSTP